MLVDYNILVSCLQRMDNFVQLSKSNHWCPSKSNTSLAFTAPLLQSGEDLTQKCFQFTPCTKFCISLWMDHFTNLQLLIIPLPGC